MSIIKDLEKDIVSAINKAGYEISNPLFVQSNRKDLGQFQINCPMSLAKKYGKSPRDIALDITKELEKDTRLTNINIAGPGFINITLTNDSLCDMLNLINGNLNINIDKQTSTKPSKIIIDYGGANVAKALHVGHLRSANIGEALKRLAKLLGYDVLGDAHLGDYGRPLGFVILEIKKRYPALAYFDETYKGDYSEIELPISNADLEKIYPEASQKAKEDEAYLEEGRDITYKIQTHTRGYYDLWKKVVDISKNDIKKTYNLLNVDFELWQGESDAMEYFDELKEIFEGKNLLTESEGAKIVEVKNGEDTSPLPPLLFIKSNGTASYETTDLATILERSKIYHPDEIWYCVDTRQELHFKQVFRAARLAEIVPSNVKLEFIGFGTMNGKDGKPFKTRDGGVMSLKSLINLVYEETLKRINPQTVPEDERSEVAKTVAIAALKYADFLPFRGTDYIFEIDKFADLEGKTGPYLLYSVIRMKSLLNKANNINYQKMYTINSDDEKELALTILNLPLVLTKAIEIKSLNDIADYLYRLTSLYNKFYNENKVLSEENEKLRESWLILTKLVYDIDSLLLDVLGIIVPEKM